MLRKFTCEDLPNFPHLHVFSYPRVGRSDGQKIYLELADFISCFVVINHHYTILVQQLRPLIDKYTLEIPMGKIEKTDPTIESAVFRELQEECSLYLNSDNSHLQLRHKKTHQMLDISIKDHLLVEKNIHHPFPAFSANKQFSFWLFLEIEENIPNLLQTYEIFSQEDSLSVHIKELAHIDPKTICVISALSLLQYQTSRISQ